MHHNSTLFQDFCYQMLMIAWHLKKIKIWSQDKAQRHVGAGNIYLLALSKAKRETLLVPHCRNGFCTWLQTNWKFLKFLKDMKSLLGVELRFQKAFCFIVPGWPTAVCIENRHRKPLWSPPVSDQYQSYKTVISKQRDHSFNMLANFCYFWPLPKVIYTKYS